MVKGEKNDNQNQNNTYNIAENITKSKKILEMAEEAQMREK